MAEATILSSERESRILKSASVVAAGSGNVRSLLIALARLGYEARLATDGADIESANVAIIPGVAAWDALLGHLDDRRLRGAIESRAAQGKPILGVCAGMQVLFEKSEEGTLRGLGLLEGEVVHAGRHGAKTPRLGWETVSWTPRSALGSSFEGVAPKGPLYFAHSFVCRPTDESIVSAVSESLPFPVVVERGRIVGVQFHPERSGESGHVLLGHVLAWMTR